MDDIKALAEELADLVSTDSLPGKAVIVVEDVPQYTESPADRQLRQLFQAVNRSDHLLIGDGDVSSMQSNFGLMADFKATKRGIAMRPDQLDGEVVFKQLFRARSEPSTPRAAASSCRAAGSPRSTCRSSTEAWGGLPSPCHSCPARA